jgi:hypothetical protein
MEIPLTPIDGEGGVDYGKADGEASPLLKC